MLIGIRSKYLDDFLRNKRSKWTCWNVFTPSILSSTYLVVTGVGFLVIFWIFVNFCRIFCTIFTMLSRLCSIAIYTRPIFSSPLWRHCFQQSYYSWLCIYMYQWYMKFQKIMVSISTKKLCIMIHSKYNIICNVTKSESKPNPLLAN